MENYEKKIQPGVTGVFPDRNQLKETLEDLKNKNFSPDEISVIDAKSKDIKKFPIHAEVITGVYTGASAGFVLGVVSCVLASLRLISLPGEQTFIESGAFLSAVAGGAIGINAGALAGVIVGYFVAKFELRKIERYIERRGVAISVHAEDLKKQLIAKNILVTHGAVKIY